MLKIRKKIPLLALLTLTFTFTPIALSISCGSKITNSAAHFSSAEEFKKALGVTGYSLQYGTIDDGEILQCFDAIKKNDVGNNFKISFVANQNHKITDSDITSNDFLVIIDGNPKANNVKKSWHEINSQWLKYFDDKSKSVFEVWNEPNPTFDLPNIGKIISNAMLNEEAFKKATSVIIFSHDKNNNPIGMVQNIAVDEGKIYLSDPVFVIRKFNLSVFDDFSYKLWIAYKNNIEWQKSNIETWKLLQDMSIKQSWK